MMSETDQKLEDEVLRRMLNTPPKPFTPKKGAGKAGKQKK